MSSIASIHLAPDSAMPVRHPATDEPMLMPDGRPQVIRLAGMDSPQFRRAVAEHQERQARKRRPAAGASEQFAIDAVAACTTGWLLEGEDGADLPFSPEAAAKIYREHRWLRQQADDWMGDRANYLGESAPG